MKRLIAVRSRWLLTALLLVALSFAGCSNSPIEGPAGSQGPAGDPGTTGATGATGPQGVAGPVGPANSGTTPIAAPTVARTSIAVQGNLIGDAAAALTGASLPGVTPVVTPPPVPITAPVTVEAVDTTGKVVSTQVLSPGDGNFILTVPTGKSYMVLFKDFMTGKTISPLIVDTNTGRVAFNVPDGSADVDLGSVTIDSQLGKAWCGTNPTLAPTTAAFPLN
ncbi:MAG: hypothetical protein ACM32I_03415, partial [Nitrospirota bacterium]